MFSHVFEQITYGVAVVAGDSFYGADSVFLNQKFAYCYDFGFGEVFVVERGKMRCVKCGEELPPDWEGLDKPELCDDCFNEEEEEEREKRKQDLQELWDEEKRFENKQK